MSTSRVFPDVSYILPIRKSSLEGLAELTDYLSWLSGLVELIVVDSSPQEVFSEHSARWAGCRHVAPGPELRTINGKVWGVLSGLKLASCDKVVIADDDVRYDGESLARIVALLDEAEVVRPQNYFEPMPWHARWDTARSLLNRLSGGDWPGTLAVHRSYLRDGYSGDCLFENLELVRTVRAAGGRERVAADVFVQRLPATTRHFLSQRVRQAYDEFARPGRMLAQLAALPLTLLMARSRPALLPLLALASVLLAEAGRRRDGGRRVFPLSASLMAPLWLSERMVCAWLALFTRLLFGGVRYHGGVIARAATPMAELAVRKSGREEAVLMKEPA
jgi:hypothetical protein